MTWGRLCTVMILGVVGCAEPLPESYPGTAVSWDQGEALSDGGDFFAFPYPSDARRSSASGGPDLTGLPGLEVNAMFGDLARIAGDLDGYPTVPVAWFRTNAPLAPRVSTDVIEATDDAPIWLIDVDPDSDERGRRIPVVAETLTPDGTWITGNVLGVAPVPGFVLKPHTTYAFLIFRNLEDADGDPLGAPREFLIDLRGDHDSLAPNGPHEQMPMLRDTLDAAGVDPETLATAAVFTTADAVQRTFDLTEQVRARYAPQIQGLAVRQDRGFDHPTYCELSGTLELPQFQQGTPPFNREGLFAFDDDGVLIEQRKTTVPVVVTIPRETMPADGFPLGMYFHGSGGTSDQLVIRGPRPPGGQAAMGYGPAHVLAQQGIAGSGAAHPVNPERLPGATSIAYLNFQNLAAFRDTFRQGVIEQRVYLDALLALEIPEAVLDGCDGAELPDGVDAYRFDPDQVVAMGQSMGGMYTNMIGAVEPRITAVVPTGAGGHWSRFILETSLLGDGVPQGLLQGLLRVSQELTFLHPALATGQTAWESAEPMLYTPRLARRPLEGHPTRPIYAPVGEGDSYFPPVVFDAMAVAYGAEQAGDDVWPGMQDNLVLDDRGGFASYPVSNNRTNAAGDPFTAVIVQYEGDGYSDPHVIFTEFDDVKHQYACFFASWLEDGVATVVKGTSPFGDCE